ncbi:YybH family protein [Rhizobium sp. LjRoot254]|uniref:YybH family protein n=1 Tax=Rhizobium sp. LjRoot254 TaxID=3342297 RepID=UPI003ECFCA72
MNAMQRQPAREPNDLERLLIERQHAGDIDGMTALFEPDAVIDCSDGQFVRGHEAIRALYVEFAATGRKFAQGEQRPALISGDLALTSTKLPDGDVTSEVARRQSDGTWLWVIDRYSVT